MKKLRIAAPISGTHRDGRKTYSVRIEEVSLTRYLIGEAYHWYDMRVPIRIPGWRGFERLLSRLGAEHRHFLELEGEPRWRDRLYGWTVEQDLRCHHYNYTWRNHVAYVDIDKGTYDRMVER